MEQEVKIHRHPTSDEEITGIGLIPGEGLKKEDVYASPFGNWRKCHANLVGHTISRGTLTIWVRPYSPENLSEN